MCRTARRPGTNLLIDTRWTGAKSDIDTVVMGPTQDCFSNGVGCEAPFTIFPGDQSVYGPYSLYPVGGSSRNNTSAGKWLWQTSTGGPRDRGRTGQPWPEHDRVA